MVLRTLALQGWCLALLTELGASLRWNRLPASADDAIQFSPEEFREYNVPEDFPESAQISFNRGKWSPTGWMIKRKWQLRAYFDMHIPKTGGTSFALDVKKVIRQGEGFYSKEMCYDKAKTLLKPGDQLIAFVRSPMAHVHSQFLECKYDQWGQHQVPDMDKPMFSNFTTWLEHFDGENRTYDMKCYNPYNMQTRAFTCRGSCHHLQSEPNVKVALQKLDSLFHVGLTEYYHESICLFYAKVRPRLPVPPVCDCTNLTRRGWFAKAGHNVRHNVPLHSEADLSQQDRDMINRMTKYDAQLYMRAKARFVYEAAQVEKLKGVKIFCGP